MKASYSHTFNTDADTFWNKIFLDAAYNKALYLEGLKFPEYEVLEERDTGSSVVRRVRIVPKQDAPAAIQKLAGGRVAYTEEGTFDKNAKRYRFKVVTASMADKIQTSGEIRVEPAGEKKIRRIIDMTFEVKIFGVGGMVESFIGKSMSESYDAAATFTNKWIAEKGL